MMIHSLKASRNKIGFLVLFHALLSAAAFAQTNVEIEMVGPWSYVQDPTDPSRIVVVAPLAGHTMAVFTGENPYVSPNPAYPAAGTHHLDFSAAACNPPSSSSPALYPVDNVTPQTIADALASPSTYSLSLPKPCSYVTKVTSRFKFNPTKPVSSADKEQKFTTWMILRYNVTDPSVPADLDKGTGNAHQIAFGSSGSSNKKAGSVVLAVDPGVGPDKRCDEHSAAIFDSALAIWKAPHVYHVFPGVIPSSNPNSNSNHQLKSYDYTCDQGTIKPDGMFDTHKQQNATSKHNLTPKLKPSFVAPGRADCHAVQINVNSTVQ